MNIDEILEFKRIITTSNLSDEQIRRLGEILENIIKSVRADAIDEVDAIIDFIRNNSFDHSFKFDGLKDELKVIGSSVVISLLEQLKEQNNE